MTTITFDTRKAVRNLKAVGFEEPQADAIVDTLGDAFSDTVATKSDIAEVQSNIAGVQSNIAGVQSDIAWKSLPSPISPKSVQYRRSPVRHCQAGSLYQVRYRRSPVRHCQAGSLYQVRHCQAGSLYQGRYRRPQSRYVPGSVDSGSRACRLATHHRRVTVRRAQDVLAAVIKHGAGQSIPHFPGAGFSLRPIALHPSLRVTHKGHPPRSRSHTKGFGEPGVGELACQGGITPLRVLGGLIHRLSRAAKRRQ